MFYIEPGDLRRLEMELTSMQEEMRLAESEYRKRRKDWYRRFKVKLETKK